MADRQDIDALMMGALYGELDTADSARLDAHLTTHPADRVTMDALTRTREAVRQLPALDPPPAISAILLQEAARRAPARRAVAGEESGFLDRLVRWFRPLSAHPAIAAFACLVLVGGAASALYVRGKGRVAEPAAPSRPADQYVAGGDSPAMGTAPAATTETAVAVAPEPTAAAPADRVGYAADVDERGLAAAALQEEAKVRDDGEKAKAESAPGSRRSPAPPKPSTRNDLAFGEANAVSGADYSGKPEAPKLDAPKNADKGVLEVRTQDPALKKLDAKDADMVPAEPSPTPSAAAPPSPTKPSGSTAGRGSVATGAAGGPSTDPGRDATYDKAREAENQTWARQQHARVVALVKGNKCAEAGRLGADIAGRAPEYFSAHIANDRNVRGCRSYIESARKKKAQEQTKTRARRSEPAQPMLDSEVQSSH